ncbi:MAG TPA: stress response translation initiation inhibitor YciH [Methanosarcinales archaeon]|nr:stress response translation initiation inhibitor YciH [Euryarchaeota archaeon]HDN64952.1 stress response translation initiation inhibitor YciH [Methanosarcinales archaeon]
MSSEMCIVCGLPKELCICEEVAKEQQWITVKVRRRRYGKEVTVIDGIDSHEIDLHELSTYLKSRFACGGTVKNETIELQGNHKDRIKDILIDRGFSASQIKT